MFKRSKYFLVVDSVESAIKFYAEKLLFTITDIGVESGANSFVNYAEMRRGKCFLVLRSPLVTELADFSMVRRLNNRASGLYLEIKKGLESFLKNCRKKKLNVVSELTRHPMGYAYFQIVDPFGSRLYFYQWDNGEGRQKNIDGKDFFGFKMTPDLWVSLKKGKVSQDVLDHLKYLGLTRRVAQKFIKTWLGKADGDDEAEA